VSPQVADLQQAADGKVEQCRVDRGKRYAAAGQRLLKMGSRVGGEDVLKVHLGHGELGSSAVVDEERDERGHWVTGVVGGMLH